MTDKLFEAALGVSPPWQVTGADFDLAAKTLTIRVDFIAGSRFALAGVEGQHPVHDTVAKRYRRKLPRQAGISKVELPATRWRYSAGVRSPSESWGRSSLYSSIHQYAASRTSSR